MVHQLGGHRLCLAEQRLRFLLLGQILERANDPQSAVLVRLRDTLGSHRADRAIRAHDPIFNRLTTPLGRSFPTVRQDSVDIVRMDHPHHRVLSLIETTLADTKQLIDLRRPSHLPRVGPGLPAPDPGHLLGQPQKLLAVLQGYFRRALPGGVADRRDRDDAVGSTPRRQRNVDGDVAAVLSPSDEVVTLGQIS